MEINVRNINQLASAMEITKYPNSPLVKSNKSKSVLVVNDGSNEYILGYITKGDTSNSVIIYSQLFSGSYGHVLNDVYNSVQNANNLSSTNSKKGRTILVGDSKFIGTVFHDGVDKTKYGFKSKTWYTIKDYSSNAMEAPVAPNKDDEHDFISLDNGNKFYQSSSGSLQEGNAMRINIGVGDTDLHSYGTWDKSSLIVETPIERLERVITEGTYASGARTGFPDPSTYHIYNFADNSSFMMGKGIIEIEKSNDDNTVFAKTVYDADGVLIEVDENAVVKLKVSTAELIIDQNNIHIKGATLNYDGDLYVSGLLMVSGTATVKGATTLETTLDVKSGKVQVNSAGKFLTTGGSDLA